MPKIVPVEDAIEFTDQQKFAIDLVLAGESIFLSGSAGTGKSFLVDHLVAKLRKRKKRVSVTATTGIAAWNVGGETIHRWSGIGLGAGSVNDLVTAIRKRRKARHAWTTVDVLVIDEISMMQPALFEKLGDIGKRLRRNSKPFGGIQMVLVGDFYQLPPVDRSHRPGQPVFCFQTELWSELIGRNTVQLLKVFRQSDALWISILEKIRRGEVDEQVVEMLNGRVDATLDIADGIVPTELYSTNSKVDAINKRELNKLDGERHVYEGVFTSSKKIPKWLEERTQQDLLEHSRVPQRLTLCVGAQVMLRANIDVDSGLANGRRGVVVGFSNTTKPKPLVRFTDGRECHIVEQRWSRDFDDGTYVAYTTIPLRLAWACTIHGSQGMTLDALKADLFAIFEQAQIYVALSRARSLESITLTRLDVNKITTNEDVKKFYAEAGKRARSTGKEKPPKKQKRKHKTRADNTAKIGGNFVAMVDGKFTCSFATREEAEATGGAVFECIKPN